MSTQTIRVKKRRPTPVYKNERCRQLAREGKKIRSSATEDVNAWPGFEYLKDLTNQCVDEMTRRTEKYNRYYAEKKPGRPPMKYDDVSVVEHKLAPLIFFKLGGRAHEILGLPSREWTDPVTNEVIRRDPGVPPIFPEDIHIIEERQQITVANVHILKRYDVDVEYEITQPDEPQVNPSDAKYWRLETDTNLWTRKEFKTKPNRKVKRSFSWPLDEQMNDEFVEWIDVCKKLKRPLLTKSYDYWRHFLGTLDAHTGDVWNGVVITWDHIYIHLFRALRCTQLGQSYDWDDTEIMNWFKWQSTNMVGKYRGTDESARKKARKALDEQKQEPPEARR